MAFNTHPNCYILYHLMNPNLAQISRVWVAASILNTCINSHPFIRPQQKYTIHSKRSTAQHSSLLTWGTNPTLGQQSQYHTAAVPNHTQGHSTAPPPTTADRPSHTIHKQKTSPNIIIQQQSITTYHDLTSSKAQTPPLQTNPKKQPTIPPTKQIHLFSNLVAARKTGQGVPKQPPALTLKMYPLSILHLQPLQCQIQLTLGISFPKPAIPLEICYKAL